MLLIFGVRGYIRTLAMITLVCGRCGNPAAHRLVERTRKFTLFFIPLFPISKTRAITCTFCGQTSTVTKEQADQYLHAAAAVSAPAIESIPAPQPPPPAGWGQPPQG